MENKLRCRKHAKSRKISILFYNAAFFVYLLPVSGGLVNGYYLFGIDYKYYKTLLKI